MPSAPICVLNGNVDMLPLTGEPGQGWSRIECPSKKAYGCGKSMEAALQDLRLYVRLGDGPLVTSSLAIRMTDEAVRRFSSEELDEGWGGADRRKDKELPRIFPVGRIFKFEQDLIVIGLSFVGKGLPDDIFYFLLYDSIDASLSLISYLPHPYNATAAFQTVPNRTVGGGGCELLLTAREMTSDDDDGEQPPVLCVFSPAAANSACPWQIKPMRFPRGKIRQPFMATKAFSFRGKGFWADLTQGLVYCDLQHTTNSTVDFGFIELPGGCELGLAETLKMRDEPPNLTWIAGCSGDSSIWFICSDHSTDYKDDSLTLWTLQSTQGCWKEEWKFSSTELWGFDGFKEAGLPEAPPDFPVLTAHDHLCLVLTDQQRPPYEDDRFDRLVSRICSIDVPNKRVLWHGKVLNYPFSDPVTLPYSFFQSKHGSHKRKFGDHRTAAGASLAF